MPTARPTLLLTRPAPQSARFAEEFRAQFGADWPVVISPLTAIRHLAPQLPDMSDATFVFTSVNAVEAVEGRFPKGAMAWCVGEKTAAAARHAGFEARTGPGSARDLASMIQETGRPGQVVYCRGRDIAFDLKNSLESAGIETVEAVVYEQVAVPPEPAARLLMAGPGTVLLPVFSAKGAERIADAFPRPVAGIFLAAISAAVARAWPGVANATAVAATPDAAGVLAAIRTLAARQDAP
ncbi:MAG: uroporphyrinogen-III synthase [Rhodobacteraceae bacterium]|nr:uroporphyrinogen-III synthase [Paracoccaceae bacterium]